MSESWCGRLERPLKAGLLRFFLKSVCLLSFSRLFLGCAHARPTLQQRYFCILITYNSVCERNLIDMVWISCKIPRRALKYLSPQNSKNGDTNLTMNWIVPTSAVLIVGKAINTLGSMKHASPHLVKVDWSRILPFWKPICVVKGFADHRAQTSWIMDDNVFS